MTVVVPGPRPFDVCGDLPTGMTLLQASAGTARRSPSLRSPRDTWQKASFRSTAFSSSPSPGVATGELREKVRERLVRAFDGLVDIIAGQGGHEDDELVQLLARGTSDEVEARRDRLGKAIANFDAATIETTHGFCLQILYGLGTAGMSTVKSHWSRTSVISWRRWSTTSSSGASPTSQCAPVRPQEAMEIAKAAALAHPDADMVPPLSQTG